MADSSKPSAHDRAMGDSVEMSSLDEKAAVQKLPAPAAPSASPTSDKDTAVPGKETGAQLREAYETDAHLLSLEQVASKYETNFENGLTTDAHAVLLARYGPNALSPKKTTPSWLLLLKEMFHGMFQAMLWAGSALCFMAYGIDPARDPTNLYLGVVLAAVVALTGVFAWYQDSSSAAIMEGFKKFLPAMVSCVRDGRQVQVGAASLVPGDVIKMTMGGKLPADIRIIAASNDMLVNNSALTGEAEPQERAVEAGTDVVMEAKNLCFFGTQVVQGSCTGVVINTADRTMMGRIAALADDTGEQETPLQREIRLFVAKIAMFATTLGVTFFCIGFIIGRHWLENLVFAIGIIVANVPEGLMPTVTVALTITAKRMAAKKVLVKNLEAVETLGSTTAICSDKTGTLTMNKMTVAHIYYDGQIRAVDHHDPLQGEFDTRDATMQLLVRVAALCNNCVYEIGVDEQGREIRDIKGDASETGITNFINAHLEGRFDDYREQYARRFAVPFNSANKWQLSVHLVPRQHMPDQRVLDEGNTEEVNQRRFKLLSIPDPSQTTLRKYNPFLYLRLKEKEEEKVGFLGKAKRRSSFSNYMIDKLPRPLLNPALMDRSSNFGKLGLSGADSALTFDPRHHPGYEELLAAEMKKHAESKAAAAGAQGGQGGQGSMDANEALLVAHAKAMKNSSATFAPMSSAPLAATMKASDVFSGGNGEEQRMAASAGSSSSSSSAVVAAAAPDAIPSYSSDLSLLVVKGASEQIVQYCDRYIDHGVVKVLSDEKRAEISKQIVQLARMGERVLGFAHLPLDTKVYTPHFAYAGSNRKTVNVPMGQDGQAGLIFVGLMAMVDPPRKGVAQAVLTCKTAGIKVIMVTGDHPTTAKAIAGQVNIITHKTREDVAEEDGVPVEEVSKDDPRIDAAVVSGTTLQAMLSKSKEEVDDFWFDTLRRKDIVFARTSPQQKLLIVEACQRVGHVVAVTGDGVNDAPALKKADIGVAMGISGTDVAKDAADMILLDDNFASIVNGIEEGRVIFDNIRKAIAYVLSSNVPEILSFLIFVAASIPLPLSTVLILCIDLGTDIFPSVSFAHEPREADIMLRPPRNSQTDNLVDWKLLRFAYGLNGHFLNFAGFYAYLVVLAEHGLTIWRLPGLAKSQQFGEDDLFCHGNTCDYFENGPSCDLVQSGKASYPAGGYDFCINAHDQDFAMGQAQTAFFVTIVLLQVCNVLIIKTRKLSILTKGLNNHVMLFGIAFEIGLCCALCYAPPIQEAFGTRELGLYHWCLSLPFFILMMVFDEVRKYVIRHYPDSTMAKITYY